MPSTRSACSTRISDHAIRKQLASGRSEHRQQRRARGREHQAAANPIEQVHTQVGFELGDVLGDSWGGVALCGSCGRNRAALGDLGERFQMRKIHHHNETFGSTNRSELFVSIWTGQSVAMTNMDVLDLHGLWVPIVTPFDRHGDLDVAQ